MCDSCAGNGAKLRELIGQFEAMIAEEPDPLTARRLRRAIDDLKASEPPADLCAGCDGDVAWADDAPVAAGS